jgi:hypothetical protein
MRYYLPREYALKTPPVAALQVQIHVRLPSEIFAT